MTWQFDYLIVGAGFAGLTMAERLTTQCGKSCLVVEKRPREKPQSLRFGMPSFPL